MSGQSPILTVTLNPALDLTTTTDQVGPDLERELLDYCRENLASYKCPRSVDFEEELPRHPTGKLYKRLLKDRYWGEKNSRIV